MFLNFILLILAYLLGSIPASLWIGQWFYHKDIRYFGSGNIGSTNAFRVLGKLPGSLAFTCDVFKGTLATLLPLIFDIHGISPLIFGLLAVFGHTFSIFAKFKGGKAVATSGGVILGFNPLFLVFLLLIFFLVLYLFSMVSLSSLAAAATAGFAVLVFPTFGFILTQYDWLFTLIVIVLAILIFLRHKANIQRIRARSESVIPFGLNLSKQKHV